ncbi:MAG: CopY family transcriptional regulator [Acidobacteria bacterium]|nr:MAG: CopY family transcriptional regulator [Acidobacteriota bacterium]
MRRPDPTLTPQELALMKIVWRRDEATVREVYEDLRKTRQVAYTTVMTMMNILAAKGYLKKRKLDRVFRYRPSRPEQAILRSMVREFVNRVFDGASSPLLLYLVKDRAFSPKEREELLRLLKEAE